MRYIDSLIKKRVIILDGAMGTRLQKLGMPTDICPEIWCLQNKKIASSIHADYKMAGVDIVYACTFGANKIKLGQYGNYDVTKVNKQLASLAKRAVTAKTLVAGDIGPTGKFIEPFGRLKFDEAVKIFKAQVKGLLLGGVDLFVIETMMDIQEARAALIAVKEITDKFTIVTMTYEKDLRTLNGTDPVTALITLQSLGANAFGCNCSTGPESMLKIIKAMKPYAKIPLVAKPNAGMPKLLRGQTIFTMGPKEFASFGKRLIACGANMLGGCCGTSPEHIKELRKKVINTKPARPLLMSISALSSARKNIVLTKNKLPLIIGECINPTGKRKLREQLRQEKTTLIRNLAKEQERAGAKILDVNVGAQGIDEITTLKKIINLLSVTSNLPLSIDSSNIAAIEAALRIYPGRALINSISGEKKKLKKLLSLAAKYGAMFILLPLNEKGVPMSFLKRKRIIQDIFKKAKKAGFMKQDIVVDGLVMPISSDSSSAKETLKTIFWARNVFKANTVIGLSNISFGMPQRPLLNATYLKLAAAKGLTTVIANPFEKEKIEAARISRTDTRKAQNVLLQKDKDAAKFLAHFSKKGQAAVKQPPSCTDDKEGVYYAVLEGNKEDIKEFIDRSLALGQSPEKIVHKKMIPAIERVGELFDKKEYFLPQLIASAEAMKLGFEYIKPRLKKGELRQPKKTIVILATVKGDIHDIGKKIVGLMLENHGFGIVDLGKDVSTKRIIKEIKKHKSPIVGLSALMITTMVNMKEITLEARKQGLNCRFLLGGAVVTPGYAHSLGAQYANDGVEAVRVAKKLSIPE